MGKSLSNTVFIVDVGFRAEHKNVRFPSSVLNQGLIWLLSWKSFIMMIYSKINRQCRAQKSSRESFRNPPRTLCCHETTLFWLRTRIFPFDGRREREREKKKKASLFAVTSSFRERKKTQKKTHTLDDFVICEKHLSVTGAALFLIPRSRGHKLLLAVRSKKKKNESEREREVDSKEKKLIRTIVRTVFDIPLAVCLFKSQGVLCFERLFSPEGSELRVSRAMSGSYGKLDSASREKSSERRVIIRRSFP